MADSLHLELLAPDTARTGEAVALTLRLTNTTEGPLEAHFLGREIAFDLTARRESGEVVWQRLAGAAVPSILQVRVLPPGAAMEWRDVWRPAVAGRYLLEGALPSDAPEPLRSAPRVIVVR